MHLLRPAQHHQEITWPHPAPTAAARVKEAAAPLRWHLLTECDTALVFRVGASCASWGEVVTIALVAGGMRLASTCRCPTQCFDWGKNRFNCEALTDRLAGRPPPSFRPTWRDSGNARRGQPQPDR